MSSRNDLGAVVKNSECVDCLKKWSYSVPVNSAAATRNYGRCWNCAAQVYNAYQEFTWKHKGFSH